jgi:hypothetical protein
MNWNRITTRIFPVWYARRNLPIFHVLFRQFPWWRSQ